MEERPAHHAWPRPGGLAAIDRHINALAGGDAENVRSLHRIGVTRRERDWRNSVALAVLIVASLFAGVAGAEAWDAAGEYSKHADQIIDRCRAGHAGGEVWFSPHPESMTLGELMAHIATTNYQCCVGLKDSEMPALPSTTDKDAIVKFLSDSASSSAGQVCPPRASSWASGNLLRLNGIKPPNYMV